MKKELVKTNIPGFVKDKASNVLLTVDDTKFETIKAGRKLYKQYQALEIEVRNLKERVNRLEAND
jgi:hypothetical protein